MTLGAKEDIKEGGDEQMSSSDYTVQLSLAKLVGLLRIVCFRLMGLN